MHMQHVCPVGERVIVGLVAYQTGNVHFGGAVRDFRDAGITPTPRSAQRKEFA